MGHCRPPQAASIAGMAAPPELRVRDTPEVVAPPVTEPASERVTVIKPSPPWPHLDVREFWHFRELFGMLVWRDVKVRYKQTFVGVAWAIVQPLMLMVVFSLVFAKCAQLSSDA